MLLGLYLDATRWRTTTITASPSYQGSQPPGFRTKWAGGAVYSLRPCSCLIYPSAWRDCMKSSWRSPDGGSSVARNTEIQSCGAVFCAWWGTGSTYIRSFHTVSEGDFSEVGLPHYGVLGSTSKVP